MSYVPKRGDVVWLTFDPQAGHEQAGRRPALVLSPIEYNRPSKLALFCPITNQTKGYPFEVALPKAFKVTGVILCDQVKNFDWQARNAVFIATVPDILMQEVLEKIETLLK